MSSKKAEAKEPEAEVEAEVEAKEPEAEVEEVEVEAKEPEAEVEEVEVEAEVEAPTLPETHHIPPGESAKEFAESFYGE